VQDEFMPDNGLEHYRSALLLLARAQLARHQQLGLEASDLVQQTFAAACRDVKQLRGGTGANRHATVHGTSWAELLGRIRDGKLDPPRRHRPARTGAQLPALLA
jgi:hypothetical protein